MKRQLMKALAIIMVFVTMIVTFTSCKKNTSKSSSSSSNTSTTMQNDKTSEDTYVVNKETGEIYNTTTNQVEKDLVYENGIIKDKNGKQVQKSAKTASSSEIKEIVENKKNHSQSQTNSSFSKDTGHNNNNNSNNISNSTGSNNSNNQFANTPTSNRTVSFNKQKLQDKMYSSYEDQKPHFTPTAVMSKDEFKMQVKGECPAEGREVFDWFMNCVKNNVSDTKTIDFSDNNYKSITKAKQFINEHTNFIHSFTSVPNGSLIIIKVDINKVNEKIDEEYKKYADPIIRNNQNNQDLYNNQLRYFNEMVAYIPETVNLVCNAVSAAGVKQGEDEVSAINKIINYISQKCNYWDWAKAQGENMGQWIRECLKDGHAVCDGYAKSFYTMCYYCGININYILGTGNGEAHSWNSIKINGKNYLFDVTWYDIQQGSAIKDKKYVWCEENDKNFNSEHKGSITTPRFW